MIQILNLSMFLIQMSVLDRASMIPMCEQSLCQMNKCKRSGKIIRIIRYDVTLRYFAHSLGWFRTPARLRRRLIFIDLWRQKRVLSPLSSTTESQLIFEKTCSKISLGIGRLIFTVFYHYIASICYRRRRRKPDSPPPEPSAPWWGTVGHH